MLSLMPRIRALYSGFRDEGGQGGEWRAGDGGEMWRRKVRVVERRGESNSGEGRGRPDSGEIVENRKGEKNQNRNGSNESDDKFAIRIGH